MNTTQIVNTLIELAAVVISTVITAVILPKFKAWMNSKVENQKYRNAIEDLTDKVAVSVNYIEQTMVIQLKADGKWNSETQKEALNKAIDTVLANISESTLSYLTDNISDVAGFITSNIESHILNLKHWG